jgi:hypothetical protein
MRTVTVFYSDGQVLRSKIQGTNTEIQNLYIIGKHFNIGIDEVNIQKVEALTIES